MEAANNTDDFHQQLIASCDIKQEQYTNLYDNNNDPLMPIEFVKCERMDYDDDEDDEQQQDIKEDILFIKKEPGLDDDEQQKDINNEKEHNQEDFLFIKKEPCQQFSSHDNPGPSNKQNDSIAIEFDCASVIEIMSSDSEHNDDEDDDILAKIDIDKLLEEAAAILSQKEAIKNRMEKNVETEPPNIETSRTKENVENSKTTAPQVMETAQRKIRNWATVLWNGRTSRNLYRYGVNVCTIEQITSFKQLNVKRDDFIIFIREHYYKYYLKNENINDLYKHLLILNVTFYGKITGIRGPNSKDDRCWIEITDIDTPATILCAYRKFDEKSLAALIDQEYYARHQKFNNLYKEYIEQRYIAQTQDRQHFKWTHYATDEIKYKFAKTGLKWMRLRKINQSIKLNDEVHTTYQNEKKLFVGRLVRCTGLVLETVQRYVYLETCTVSSIGEIKKLKETLNMIHKYRDTTTNAVKCKKLGYL